MSLPRATYRLQFREGMDFARACEVVPYLADLGVSHIYASPIFQATTGSTHGYDVTDHRHFDTSLGGDDGFVALSDALKRAGIGLILDIVPNHMAASVENPWWADVLRNGRDSRYAGHFDIDWSAPRLVLPVLGQPYGDALDAGELSVGRTADGPCLRYYEHAFPLSPESGRMLSEAAGADPAHPLDDDTLARLSGDRALVHRLHEAQAWRLAYWRLARDGLTYRRFFEISELVGVRVEEPEVFDDVHRFLFEMIEAGRIDGVRIDHVDGLADPGGYLHRLAQEMPRKLPVWVEKILARGERLPEGWPVVGTTGYEFADATAALLTDADGAEKIGAGYDRFTGRAHDYEAMLEDAKRKILTANLAAELDTLTDLALRAFAGHASDRDWGRDSVRRALAGVLMAMPVYRTYLSGAEPSAADREILDHVRREAPALADLDDPSAIAALLRHLTDGSADADRQLRTRFQQTTGALMAKAVEDTLFYRYNRLISANEVGGEPDHPALSPDAFIRRVSENGAGALNATATHDTKRGEDARARIAALAEMPGEWLHAVRSFDAALGDGIEAETRWLFYQALLGAWEDGPPDDLRDRTHAYMVKAAREAKMRTTWVRTNEAFEGEIGAFVDGAFRSQAFLAGFARHSAPFIEIGRRKSLVQLALKLTAPGIPDIYQGTETPDLSYVDPDNRRPVDFAARHRAIPDGGDGGRKIALMGWGLQLRRDHPEVFSAPVTQLPLEGDPARILAFERADAGKTLVVIADLSGRWQGDRAPLKLTDGRPLLARFPSASDGTGDPLASALSVCSVSISLHGSP